MPALAARPSLLTPDVCRRALDARDARFDGIFFVGITTTRIYCRPVCPARVSYPERRRFFDSAASAEREGFRPCLRCRPELAPGRALIDAVPRLATVAAHRIGAGALNGRGVAELAVELGVSERHLRRALERELGVSPVQLAQTHRLLLAKRLLVDTSLPVTRIAFASGFQSLRRFNSVFQERYRLSPSALRRGPRAGEGPRADARRPTSPPAENDLVRLMLAYRAPLAWGVLTELLRRDAMPGVEVVEDGRYGRTIRLDGRTGVVFAENAVAGAPNGHAAKAQLTVEVSPSLLPVLMPLLSRVRHLFDLDAEPGVIDACLEREGLGELVRRRRGLRLPGALDGFEIALRSLLAGPLPSGSGTGGLAGHVVEEIGEPVRTTHPALTRIAPGAERVTDAGSARLVALGVPPRRAEIILTVARAVADGRLRLEPGCDAIATRRALMEIDGIGDRLATTIVMRALYWPDAFPATDRTLQVAAGVSSAAELRDRAERWRPWRAYAALHLWMGRSPAPADLRIGRECLHGTAPGGPRTGHR
jgi:AraC family transcriptional regulator of adaptative response / DNA-3-methyladenine glycosylase II